MLTKNMPGLDLTFPSKESIPVTQSDIQRLECKVNDVSNDVSRVCAMVEASSEMLQAAIKGFDRAQDRAEKTEDRVLKMEERLTKIEVNFAEIASRYGKIMAGTAGGGVFALLANAAAYYFSMPR